MGNADYDMKFFVCFGSINALFSYSLSFYVLLVTKQKCANGHRSLFSDCMKQKFDRIHRLEQCHHAIIIFYKCKGKRIQKLMHSFFHSLKACLIESTSSFVLRNHNKFSQGFWLRNLGLLYHVYVGSMSGIFCGNTRYLVHWTTSFLFII